MRIIDGFRDSTKLNEITCSKCVTVEIFQCESWRSFARECKIYVSYYTNLGIRYSNRITSVNLLRNKCGLQYGQQGHLQRLSLAARYMRGSKGLAVHSGEWKSGEIKASF